MKVSINITAKDVGDLEGLKMYIKALQKKGLTKSDDVKTIERIHKKINEAYMKGK